MPGALEQKSDGWAQRFSAWGSLVVTAAIFANFTAGLMISAQLADPPPAFTNLMETVKAVVMVAVGFWLGSSNSSQKKDDATAATNAVATAALANSIPVAALPSANPPAPEVNADPADAKPSPLSGAMRPTGAP